MLSLLTTVSYADPGHVHSQFTGEPLSYQTSLGEMSWETVRAVCGATDVLVGTVVHQVSFEGPVLDGISGETIGQEVFTTITLKVEESYRGTQSHSVDLIVKGGTYMGVQHRVPAGPRPELGRRYAIAYTPVPPVRNRAYVSHRYAATLEVHPKAAIPSRATVQQELNDVCHP